MIALLKSDRFGMEILFNNLRFWLISNFKLKSDRFGMEILTSIEPTDEFVQPG